VADDTKTVLVVDDEGSIRLLCRVNLELEGFRVLEAGTLDEAREQLEREAVDVVLLDVHVGSAHGYTLLREIRDRGDDLPVALLSGSVEIEAVDSSLADAVISKPFSLEKLGRTVRELAEVSSS
jgi:DNA-binding NtrC family response regulator